MRNDAPRGLVALRIQRLGDLGYNKGSDNVCVIGKAIEEHVAECADDEVLVFQRARGILENPAEERVRLRSELPGRHVGRYLLGILVPVDDNEEGLRIRESRLAGYLE